MEERNNNQRQAAEAGLYAKARRARIRRRNRRRLRRLIALIACCLLVFGTVCWVQSRFFPPKSVPAAPFIAPFVADPPGIILHSSNSPASYNGIPINAAQLETIHAHDHPDWATLYEGKIYHIGYHYVILPDGTIEKGRPDHCPGCHAPHFNDWLGICVIGCFDPSVHHHWKPSRPTPAQIASVISLCERLMSEYHIPPENVRRHRDTKQTWCPGRRFPYAAIMVQLRQYAAAHPETRPLTPPVITSNHPIVSPARRRQ